MHDLAPAAAQMSALITNIPDDALGGRTPCPDYSLGDLVEHVGGLAKAFTEAATKSVPPGTSQPPKPDAGNLEDGWRERIAGDLDRLGAAWREPDAWTGMTEAGSVQMPGEVAGLVALNELVVHGWDVARGSGQDFRPEPADLQACHDFVAQFSGPGSEGARPPIYGPEIAVSADAALGDRLIGMAGRDPQWSV